MTNQFLNQTKNPLAENVFAYQHKERDLFAESLIKYRVGAYMGLIGGFLILVGAIFLTVFEYFSGEKSHSFWLFLSIYPLFAIGAHCLDKISELKNKAKNISDENDKQII